MMVNVVKYSSTRVERWRHRMQREIAGASPPSLLQLPSSIIHLNNVIVQAWNLRPHAGRRASLDSQQFVSNKKGKTLHYAMARLGITKVS